MPETQSGKLISADCPARSSAGAYAVSALRVPAGRWSARGCEPCYSGLGFRSDRAFASSPSVSERSVVSRVPSPLVP